MAFSLSRSQTADSTLQQHLPTAPWLRGLDHRLFHVFQRKLLARVGLQNAAHHEIHSLVEHFFSAVAHAGQPNVQPEALDVDIPTAK